jgi:hypothetical protein
MTLKRNCLVAFALGVLYAITFGQGFAIWDNPVPTLASVAPSVAMRSQTLNVRVEGSNFLSGVTTMDLGVDIHVNSITVENSAVLVANITVDPTAELGARNACVANALPGGGVAVLSAGFVVGNTPPAITSIPVPDIEGIPALFALDQNYPNPFNPSTTIRFGLPVRAHVVLAVFTTLGQQVAQLVDNDLTAGYHRVTFDGAGLSSGLYFYRLHASSLDAAIARGSKDAALLFTESKTFLLIR